MLFRSVVNIYEYTPNQSLKVLHFSEMSEEWLDFIAACRSGSSHDYDRAIDRAAKLQTHYETLRAMFPENPTLIGAKRAAADLDALIARTAELQTDLEALRRTGDLSDLAALTAGWSETVQSMRAVVTDSLKPAFDAISSDLTAVLNTVEPLLRSVQGGVEDLASVLDGAQSTVTSVDSDIKATSKAIDNELKILLKAVSDTQKSLSRFSAELERRADL